MPATVEDDANAPPVTTRRLCKNYDFTVKSINRFLEKKDQAKNIDEVCTLSSNLLNIVCNTRGYHHLELHTRNAKNAMFGARRNTSNARPILRDAARFATARHNSEDWRHILRCNDMNECIFKLAKQRCDAIRLVLFSLRHYKEREQQLAEWRLKGFRVVLSVMWKNAERGEPGDKDGAKGGE
jgi:hypothetical protein